MVGCLTLARDKAQLEEDLTMPDVIKEHFAAAAVGAEESRKAPENTPLNTHNCYIMIPVCNFVKIALQTVHIHTILL